MSEVQPSWTTAQKLVEKLEPCDIVEIRFEKPKPAKSHFVINIRKGWCVNVISARDEKNNNGSSTIPKDEDGNYLFEGFKDAVDLIGLAGRHPCRINNLAEVAEKFGLNPRGRKETLQIARQGLAEGAVAAGIRTRIEGDPSKGEDISKQFCLYWKYEGAAVDADAGVKFLDKTIAVFGLVIVLIAAVTATSLSF